MGIRKGGTLEESPPDGAVGFLRIHLSQFGCAVLVLLDHFVIDLLYHVKEYHASIQPHSMQGFLSSARLLSMPDLISSSGLLSMRDVGVGNCVTRHIYTFYMNG